MLNLDPVCIGETTDSISRLASRAKRDPLLEAAAQAQACDRPRILLDALARVREALDEVEGVYRAGLRRAGIDVAADEKRRDGIRRALASYPLTGIRPGDPR